MLPRILLLLAVPACSLLTATAESKPNIILFVSDDMGWNDVGYHGSKVRTPHIDQLVKDGVELDRFYVYPICSPTRAALLTGRTPIHFGILAPVGGRQGIPADEVTLPEALKKAGYQTFLTGKWHLGAQAEELHPLAQGFDHFYGHESGFIDYYTHENNGRHDWQRNGKELKEEGYSTDLIANEAIQLLKNRNQSKPAFLYVAFNAPHSPWQVPQEYLDKYQDAEGIGRNPARAAMIDAMDAAIGRILATLDDEGMTKDTLVLFFCDNGANAGGAGRRPRRPDGAEFQRGMGNSPLSGGKGSLQDGGLRVPAVLKWPGVVKAGTKSEQFLSVMDLLPTLCAAAGVEHGATNELEGVNVWPALVKGKTMPRKPIPFATQNRALAVIDPPMKLIKAGGGLALYDLVKDPSEEEELSATHPEVVADLLIALEPYEELMANMPERPGRRRN